MQVRTGRLAVRARPGGPAPFTGLALCVGVALAAGLARSTVASAQPPPMQDLPMILGLQPGQEAAWRAYRDAAAVQRADALHQSAQAEQLNVMPTPQRLDAMQDQLRANERVFLQQAQATKAFYSTLSPQQKTIFDQVTRLPTRPAPRPPPGPPDSRLRAPQPGQPDLPQPAY